MLILTSQAQVMSCGPTRQRVLLAPTFLDDGSGITWVKSGLHDTIRPVDGQDLSIVLHVVEYPVTSEQSDWAPLLEC
jgi:hypothetical protein